MGAIKLVKQAFGRELSDAMVEQAKTNGDYVNFYRICSKNFLFPGTLAISGIDGENIIIGRFRYEIVTTPDASHGWKRPHVVLDQTYSLVRTYTADGKLLRSEEKHHPTPYQFFSEKVEIFDPPGSFFGRKESFAF